MDPAKPAGRRFAPQPVETTTRSSRPKESQSEKTGDASATHKEGAGEIANTGKPRRKFAVEPVETSTRSNKAAAQDEAASKATTTSSSSASSTTTQDAPKKPARRRFAPELIETAHRSRKAGDPPPQVLESNKRKQDDANDSTKRPGARPPLNTPEGSQTRVPQLMPPQQPLRQGSLHPHYPTRAGTRAHSYQVPDLEPIESSESESDPSRPPSLSQSPSASEESYAPSDHNYRHPTRMRESADEKFSGYLLALAAKTAEKQLREQADAAFLNSDTHTPVAHYADLNDDDESVASSTPKQQRRRFDSDEDLSELAELKRHGQKAMGKQKEELPKRKKTAKTFNVEFDDAINHEAWVEREKPKKIIGGNQRDIALENMRKAASPPMLGDDLDFPRCASPENARFDVTQGAEYLRHSMCYLTDKSKAGQNGLWSVGTSKGSSQDHLAPGLNLTRSQSPSDNKKPDTSQMNNGLWGGFCTEIDSKLIAHSPGLTTPLRTPVGERDDPFAHPFSHVQIELESSPSVNAASKRHPQNNNFPPSPPASNSNLSLKAADERLELEYRIDTEFDDAFVTQVYNYLSLGYPSLAKKYDDELARISRVPVHELRQDDKLAEARGYIRLGADEPAAEALADFAPSKDGVRQVNDNDPNELPREILREDVCVRWRALRKYVREWGRQQLVKPAKEGPLGHDPAKMWGLPARKGSWGL